MTRAHREQGDKMNYFITYLSKRNIPLILKHLPDKNEPLLTIENWEEWDNIYTIDDEAIIISVFDDLYFSRQYSALIDKYKNQNKISYYKHNNGFIWNPEFLIDFADEIGYVWETMSFEMIAGRWEIYKEGIE